MKEARPFGRPEFIPREAFRKPMSNGGLNKYFRVGNSMAGSYVAKLAREGRPIKSFQGWHRPIDVVARARAEALEVSPSTDKALSMTREELEQEIERLRAEAADLRSRVSGESHKVEMNYASIYLTGKTLLRPEEIIKGKLDLPSLSGVYFLISGDEIVYVGQSTNVFVRVREHQFKEYDGFAFVSVGRDMLDVMESLYIHFLRPSLNGSWSNGLPCAPMKLNEIFHRAGIANTAPSFNKES